jgi:hypothetical protein
MCTPLCQLPGCGIADACIRPRHYGHLHTTAEHGMVVVVVGGGFQRRQEGG